MSSLDELAKRIADGEVISYQGKLIMTGAMWYDRFVEALDNLKVTEEDKKRPYDRDRVAQLIEDKVLEAAQKAAGIDTPNQQGEKS